MVMQFDGSIDTQVLSSGLYVTVVIGRKRDVDLFEKRRNLQMPGINPQLHEKRTKRSFVIQALQPLPTE